MCRIRKYECKRCHRPHHLQTFVQRSANIDPEICQCSQEDDIDATRYIELCDNCYVQERSLYTIDFAVEEAMFRAQQDTNQWTAARWLGEREDFRARRMERVTATKGGYPVSYYCRVLCAGTGEQEVNEGNGRKKQPRDRYGRFCAVQK